MNLEKLAETTGLRIIVVLLLHDQYNQCIYRVYTSDGGYIDYVGFDRLPKCIREWLKVRNCWEYTIPGCMVVSGVSVNG